MAQALQGDRDSIGNQLVGQWLEKLFNQGMRSLEDVGGLHVQSSLEEQSAQQRAALAINVIAMFNLTAGYFLSQRAFDCMAEGELVGIGSSVVVIVAIGVHPVGCLEVLPLPKVG